MKIGLVILHGNPSRGGAERYTADLASALDSRGHETTLIASTLPDRPPTRSVRLAAGSGGRSMRYLRFLDSLDAHLATEKYDIVHAMLPVRRCDLYHPHAGLAAEAIASGHLKYDGAFMQTISRVATGLNRRRKLFASTEKKLITSPNPPLVLCLSHYIERSMLRHYDLPERSRATLLNGVNLSRFDPALRPDAGKAIRERLKIAPDKIIALMIAQDFFRKGVGEAISAMGGIQDDRLVLVVVGKDDPKPYRARVKQGKLDSRVIFAGPTDDPYAFYRSADFFLLPTRHDPCSLVVLEALAMGLPVISTLSNGACEAMEDGKQGYILKDATETVSLVHAMRQMLDPTTRSALAAAALALRPRLSYDTHVQSLLAIYERARDLKKDPRS